MSWHNNNPLRDSLARVRGLGSAHEGVGHWWSQRVSAVALIFLSIWFVYFLNLLPLSADAHTLQIKVLSLLQSPWTASLLVSFVGVSIYHSFLGIQVIIEDYIHSEMSKWLILVFVKLFFGISGLVGIVAVLKMAL
jgi:succinate dehydrogenase / fumarate reductase membrane anchor subunit